MTVNPMEAEFLEQKEEIIRRMAEGKIASKVHKKMYEDEKLTMCYSTFRSYCDKYGIELRKIPLAKRENEK
jgi:hypothetical protein